MEGPKKMTLPYTVEWNILQPSYLVGSCKDLNWLAVLGRLPVREQLYRHGQGSSPLCPVGCGQEETIEHALWSCPGAAMFWQLVTKWWKEWRWPSFKRELLLREEGLKDLEKDQMRIVWGVISEGKNILWEWRTACLKKQLPCMLRERLFSRLLGKMVKEVNIYKEFYREDEVKRVWEGLPRVGVG